MKKIEKFVVLGNGGHSAVIVDLIESLGLQIKGVLTCDINNKHFLEYPVLGDDSKLNENTFKKFNYAIGVAWVNDSLKTRIRLFENLKRLKLSTPTLIHKTAIVSSRSYISDGCQILAGAIVGAESAIGQNCIINTGAKIDHGTIIGPNCHIAPGVTICGNVVIGENTFIGAGTTIINDIKITKNCTIGAGSLVLKSIVKPGMYFGSPVKKCVKWVR